MKKLLFSVFILVSLFSCKEKYNPDIDTNKQVLVVEGLITNEQTAYQIKLSYTVPYDSTLSTIPVSGAIVTVSDKNGSIFHFTENSFNQGVYFSNPSEFTGTANNEYTLSIVTPDGNTYESTPQILLSNVNPINAFGEKSVEKSLIEINGETTTTTKEGVRIFVKFNSIDNTTPRFRFKYAHLSGYIAGIEIGFGEGGYVAMVYGWRFSQFSSDFAMTSEKFSFLSNQITDQEICFFEKLLYEDFHTYSGRRTPSGDIIIEIASGSSHNYLSKRIVYINKYRLNNDAYQYYLGIKNQLDADNKLFDPVTPQIIGNMTCTSDPDKLALGFFETSSVEYLAYSIAFIRPSGDAILTPTTYSIPVVKEGVSITKPDFWGE
jgi:hypothetical protein